MKENHLFEAVLDNTEVIVDQFIDNEIVKEIPIFGTALKIIKGTLDIRDRMFGAKIAKFLTTLESVSEETKEKIKEKVRKDPEEIKKVGEVILLTIDKLTDLEKSSFIAILFMAYIDGYITNLEFRRLVEAIDLAFIDDLNQFLEIKNPPKKSKESYLRYLYRSGLTEIVAGKTYEDSGEIFYELTKLGNKLLHAYRHGVKLVN